MLALSPHVSLRARLVPRLRWATVPLQKTLCKRRELATRSSDVLERVRNIGIIAHIDAGKTTTTERMLHYAGFTRTIGNVDSGDTVMDYLPAERSRGITIQSAAITFGWRNHQLHLIDTPGHVDFTVEVERAMRVLDGAVTIIDAVAGVQAQTQTVWKQAARYAIPRIAFINKMDRDGASWTKCINDIRVKLGAQPLVVQIPGSKQPGIGSGSLETWVDVVTMEKIIFDISHDNTGSTVKREELTRDTHQELYETAAQAREQLVEALAEIDAQIVEVFLNVDDHMKVPADELRRAIRRTTVASLACPVLLGASYRNIGVQPLLDAIIDYLPSPTDRPLPLALVAHPSQQSKRFHALTKQDAQSEPVRLDPNEKLIAFAFKVIADQQRGPMVFVRVYSGTLDARMALVNATQGGAKERALKLLQMYADVPEEISSVPCGHICVILGLKQTKTGDTLLHPHHPTLAKKPKSVKKHSSALVTGGKASVVPVGLQLHGIDVPPPVFFCAVEADSPQDERPLTEALGSLMLEDPSLHVATDEETGQTLLSGMGELHLEIVRDRLVNDMKINASFGTMRVSYREMAGTQTSSEYTYTKEIAGKVGKAAMRVAVEPINEEADPGADASDGNTVDVELPYFIEPSGTPSAGDHSPELRDSIREAIAQGVRNALYRGTVLGFPVTRTRVHVTQVQFFGPELSTEAAYRACAAQALFQAFRESNPTLLEPVAKVTVLCPESHVGSVLSDLNGVRKGRVLALDNADSESTDTTNVTKTIDAEVPLSTMLGYSSSLRSLTAGSGTFSMEVTGFGPMPAQQQQQVIKESQGYY
ncbi:Ribosome-releasing factor 2, mitochondrial [Coemansia sp. RSA 1813]|nr:Ribosome-releasing factor 2, mitochondrial [Coemansia sp. RSA 1646]KAJ1770895.1 Ribosome-releasing factor 2, mitochondrial [Coemansia sp. RSA 1843]KAJ2092896.1 Ribosome-releasing factor 2, mitochondrial [Coemansia sp. RSA 986]KAJ2216217.1 Ribosome-releasing factor 2, mitochondrial [Coemansia sp. RSA 487]KAJ2570610.1 Ribosome-releasing factor 2, mitochondrial [Coemansia sp. RSA 1813]